MKNMTLYSYLFSISNRVPQSKQPVEMRSVAKVESSISYTLLLTNIFSLSDSSPTAPSINGRKISPTDA